MGVAAGLLHLRKAEDRNHGKSILHDIFPWTFTQEEQSEITEEEAEKSWQSRVDRNVLVLVTVILMSLLRSVIPGMPYLNMRTQFFCVHLQLMVIVGLSRDGGRSWLSWICR